MKPLLGEETVRHSEKLEGFVPSCHGVFFGHQVAPVRKHVEIHKTGSDDLCWITKMAFHSKM